ncbi:MAG: diacylglycerol kinase family lipid kinase [Lachnospiraceae bacterium]|nr:diacylglycerol kinase family lipid kinase [Lachnospiraceae bacterium]
MYTFLVNPASRSSLGKKVWHTLEEQLKEKEVPYQVFFTKYQRNATKLAAHLCNDLSVKTLIVLGGDGTLNEVIDGIPKLSDITLGYIPIGSSNDFARSMGLSKDPIKALSHILEPTRFAYLNVGVTEYDVEGSSHHRRRFAVSSGLGFDAGVCHQVIVSPLKRFFNKLHLGKLSYVGVALFQLFTMTPDEMHIELTAPSGETKSFAYDRVYFAAAMNQRTEGGGFRFCPKSNPSDDLLDVIVVEGFKKLVLLMLLPTAFKGWHVIFKGIHTFQCEKATFTSKKPLPVHTDGEPVYLKREITCSLEPEKIRLILS